MPKRESETPYFLPLSVDNAAPSVDDAAPGVAFAESSPLALRKASPCPAICGKPQGERRQTPGPLTARRLGREETGEDWDNWENWEDWEDWEDWENR